MVFRPRKKDISAGLLNSILMNFCGCFGSVAKINGLTMNFDFIIYEPFLCHNDLGYSKAKKT